MKTVPSKQQPEALAKLSEATAKQTAGKTGASLTADRNTKPIPTQNKIKHDVAEKLLHAGAEGSEPDPKAAGEDRLPDRTRSVP
jgi:hypothetical protein